MDFSEKWGTSVEEAVELALKDLKLGRDEVEVTVLEQPSKGFFGIGSKLAKVRVEKKEPEKAVKEEKTEKAVQPAAASVPKSEENIADKEIKETIDENKPVPEKSAKKEREKKAEKVSRERPDDLEPVSEDNAALVFLKEVTEKMGLDLSITAAANEESIYVDIEGKDSGTIIGKRGQTLDALQYLTSLVVNKGEGRKYLRVVVDAENYRAKRERTLEQLAERLAGKVVRTKRSVRLEPMNPYERKVIHATLQANPHVTTRSEGDEPYRRVIIELK